MDKQKSKPIKTLNESLKYNPILEMLKNKAKIATALREGKSLSGIEGVKIVSPL